MRVRAKKTARPFSEFYMPESRVQVEANVVEASSFGEVLAFDATFVSSGEVSSSHVSGEHGARSGVTCIMKGFGPPRPDTPSQSVH